MDVVPTCRDKLRHFRIKELKDVLAQLGLSKQGKKQDLMDKILSLLSDEQVPNMHVCQRRNFIGKEGVAKIIDETYRKMQIPGAMNLTPTAHSYSTFNHVKPKEEADLYMSEAKGCLCGESPITGSTIQCEDPKCRVRQHIACVIIPEKTIEGASPEISPYFYCEICRINRADPFWVTKKHILPPVKLLPSDIVADGTSTLSVDRIFQLSSSDWKLIQRPEYDLQVWSILLNDKVPFRMQWPQHAELFVNDVAVGVPSRTGPQLLGINGRDDGAVITTRSGEGNNKIILLSRDARIFCFGIRLAMKRTVLQVLDLVPKEAEVEQFQDALSRVCRCIGGGAAKECEDSDSDLEMVADFVTVNLCCPLSGSRIRIAGRFRPCVHMRCFDLETFVELNQRSRKWQCPMCLKNYSLENIIIDPYFNRITSMLQNCGEDVTEIDVKPDGCWRVKNETKFGHLSKWHSPAGTLCAVTDGEVKMASSKLRHIKHEKPLERDIGLNVGMEPNSNTTFEVHKPQDNRLPCVEIRSYTENKDQGVDQDIGIPFDISLNNAYQFGSFSLNLDPLYGIEEESVPLKDPYVLLSDSEDNLTLMSLDAVYDAHPAGSSTIPLPNHPGVSEGCIENAGVDTSVNVRPGLFDNHTDEFGMSIWPTEICPRVEPGFQLFAADIPDILPNAPIDTYGLPLIDGLVDTDQVQDFTNFHPNTMLGNLVDDPLVSASNDPSLQIFFPNQPVGVAMQDDLIDDPDVSNGLNSNLLTPRQQFLSKESQMNFSDDAASLVLSMCSDELNKVISKDGRSDSSSLPSSQHLYFTRDRLF